MDLEINNSAVNQSSADEDNRIYSGVMVITWLLGLFYLYLYSENKNVSAELSVQISNIANYGTLLFPLGIAGIIYFIKLSFKSEIAAVNFINLIRGIFGWIIAYVIVTIFFKSSTSYMKVFLMQFTGAVWLLSSSKYNFRNFLINQESEWKFLFVSVSFAAVLLFFLLSILQIAGRFFSPQMFDLSLTSTKPAWNKELIELLLKIIAIPFCEEVLFRIGLIGWLKPRTGNILSILISAALFAFLHMQNGIFWARFLAGIFLGILYLKTGKIAAPLLLHSIMNAGIILLPAAVNF